MWEACMKMFVFYTRVFYRVHFFLRPPHQLVVFFTLVFFYTMYVFFSLPYMRFLHESFFLQSAILPLAPPSTGSFFLHLGFLHNVRFFSPPPHDFLQMFFYTALFPFGPSAY